MYIWKLLQFFVHVIGWNGARWKWLIFFLYFLKLNLIFHSIRFRFIFVFRVIILLDEIFSSLFESSHFIIIKIVVDFLYFIILKEADDTCYGISSFQWFIPERVRFDANLGRKKSFTSEFCRKSPKSSDGCLHNYLPRSRLSPPIDFSKFCTETQTTMGSRFLIFMFPES